MKMRPINQPGQEFEAEITTNHSAGIPGPIALKRKDSGEYIALRDCLGLPGTPFKKYDLLEVNAEEQAQLDEAGLMIGEVAPLQQEDMRKIALPVQHIDCLGSGADAVAIIWIDLSERPDLVQVAQGHLGERGIAECTWYAPDLAQRNAHLYFRLQAQQPTQNVLILGLDLATYHTQLSRIARDRFLWIMGGPRPDYLVEEYANDPADLSERLTTARGQGITLGLHPTLAQELEALLLTWQEAQARQN